MYFYCKRYGNDQQQHTDGHSLLFKRDHLYAAKHDGIRISHRIRG